MGAVLGARIVGNADAIVTGVTHDSTRVLPGTLFCCLVGARFDGHDFAEAAVSSGATALLVERQLDVDVTQIVVPSTRSALGPVSAAFWGDPSQAMDVIGVTGTNGKTTVVTIIEHLLAELGQRCGVIGTLTGTRTTPEAPELQAQLRAFADGGYTSVAMEVSSHALALGRVDGTRFAVTLFTNLGTDHLDFHGTPERYFQAKAMLFDSRFTLLGLVNIDDVHGRLLRDAATIPMLTYSLTDLDDLRLAGGGAEFGWRGHQVSLPLAGRFNVSNALAAAEALVALGHDAALVAAALETVTAPPGRFEVVDRGQPFAVIVDYAHTPDALDAAIAALRPHVAGGGRLIVVFGAGGDRDTGKRPEMGAVTARAADLAIVTDDNPRSEDPASIRAAILAGAPSGTLRDIGDRRAAIAAAIGEAGPRDIVLITGKGHEQGQIFGSGEKMRIEAFDDVEVARQCAGAKAGSANT